MVISLDEYYRQQELARRYDGPIPAELLADPSRREIVNATLKRKSAALAREAVARERRKALPTALRQADEFFGMIDRLTE